MHASLRIKNERKTGSAGAHTYQSVSGVPYAKTTRPMVRAGAIFLTTMHEAELIVGGKMVCSALAIENAASVSH